MQLSIKREKKAGIERDRLEKEMETQKGRQEKGFRKSESD